MDIYEKVKNFYESAKTEKKIIGKSLFGRNLYAVKMGEGAPVAVAQYAMHGREYCVAELAFEHYKKGVPRGSFWLLPLTNPDGALLSEKGLETAPKEARERLIALNGGEDFSLWKANGRGVDLNVNFPALWGTGEKNVRRAGRENFIGEHPFSEPETKALKKFTEKIRPYCTVSYHTKGEEIYWYFFQPLHDCARDKRLAQALSASTGYPLAYAKNSAGGYKDWCILRWRCSAFTVEAGADSFSHPLKEEGLANIIEKNQSALYDLSKKF